MRVWAGGRRVREARWGAGLGRRPAGWRGAHSHSRRGRRAARLYAPVRHSPLSSRLYLTATYVHTGRALDYSDIGLQWLPKLDFWVINLGSQWETVGLKCNIRRFGLKCAILFGEVLSDVIWSSSNKVKREKPHVLSDQGSDKQLPLWESKIRTKAMLREAARKKARRRAADRRPRLVVRWQLTRLRKII